jgi:hypothetical protein
MPGSVPDMVERIRAGIIAGAVGTVAINVVSTLDMAVRGRPASSLPGEVAQRVAARAGISLRQGEHAEHRREALGELAGYATGTLIGVAYGVAYPVARHLPPAWRSAAVGLAAMAATDGVSAALRATDPRSWSAADWASDIVPHLAYGAGTVGSFEGFDR